MIIIKSNQTCYKQYWQWRIPLNSRNKFQPNWVWGWISIKKNVKAKFLPLISFTISASWFCLCLTTISISPKCILLPLIIKCWIEIEGDILSCSLLPVLVVVVKLENVGSFLTILHLDNLNNIGFTIYVLKYLSTPFPLYCSTIELLECYSIFSVIFRSDYLCPACVWKQKLALLASFTKGMLYLRLSSITNKPAWVCDLQSHY